MRIWHGHATVKGSERAPQVRSSAAVLSAHRGNVVFLKEHHVSNTSAISSPAITTPLVSANTKTIALLAGTAFLALLVYYFIGVDEGAVSVFGKSMMIHEFFHDGRHLLGFACH